MTRTNHSLMTGARRRTRKRYVLSALGVIIVALWVIGFSNFVSSYNSLEAPVTHTGEGGIVVFTGPRGNRVWFGMEALSNGLGDRLLISGVNADVTRADIRALVEDPNDLFECCVDLDYVATNTWQNARETALWASAQGYNEIVLVTAPYHRQRALVILRYFLPGAEISVYDRIHPDDRLNPSTFTGLRILAWEYTKYELALARIRLSRLAGLSG